ncbi:hypothetical protein P691DRAFT_758115 [Macrolepiota fuliginosa MF-IS2]|uniref:Uncharacterized protein n=1 Tax=Macrolepiota fuliginosa MF-IS2 TaxID=1400762 RepID=A0A9P5XHL2_9AGAR|nr:hypothetical protein P691DRAFT_758115 [Macrolepiota fuliginosa MF-IS2]
MLSSIASFLPSALHIGLNDIQKPPQFSQDDPVSEDEHDELLGSRRKLPPGQPEVPPKPREKSANESFVIVRPPPSKSNHPLNLQVQLVPPNTKPPNGVVSQSNTSVQSASTETDHTLARSSSVRSESSYTNYGSSTSSFTSVASSSTSARRTIVPLYNLQAHNVMTNVIVDAGTDAKIAKFQRRGIILIDLAILEPVEVWGDSPSAGRHSLSLNVEDQRANNHRSSTFSARSTAATSSGAHTPERHLTAASSAISLNSAQQSQSHPPHLNPSPPQPQYEPPPPLRKPSAPPTYDSDTTPTLSTPRPQPTSTSGKRNIFGKLFQSSSSRKLVGSSSPLPSPSPSPAPELSSFPNNQPVSQDFAQTTPKPSLQLQQSGVATPTPNDSTKAEKAHTRNISLTSFTSPIKTTFRSNKIKLSSAIGGSSSSSSLNTNNPLDSQDVGLGITTGGRGKQAVPSPSVSASSLAATSESMESGTHCPPATGNPLLQVYTHLHPSSHSHQPSTGSTSLPTPQTQLQQLQSRPPVLGIQPTYVSALGGSLLGPSDMKKMRALMYVWLVRRWFKRAPYQEENGTSFPSMTGGGGGFLGLGARGRDSGTAAEPGAGVEIRFEWKRGKVKASGRGRSGKEKGDGDAKMRKRRSNGTIAAEWDEREREEGGRTERGSPVSRKSGDRPLSSISTKSNQSLGSGEAGSEEGREKARRGKALKRPMSAGVASYDGASGDTKDDGEESDPEDSETPWVCTLKVRRTVPLTGGGHANHSSKGGGEREVVKLKVGTLSPMPHHPKVVAMLKVPFPLPDIEVERLSVRRRIPAFAPGQGGVNEFGGVRQSFSTPRGPARGAESQRRSQDDEYKGLTLAAEEIKDIVCSTALWLVVREGTGGVGRISRKGDGWKLRS